MNAMQKAVVKNMEWANSVPTYQVSRAITTDELDALYKEVSANKKNTPNVSWNRQSCDSRTRPNVE